MASFRVRYTLNIYPKLDSKNSKFDSFYIHPLGENNYFRKALIFQRTKHILYFFMQNGGMSKRERRTHGPPPP